MSKVVFLCDYCGAVHFSLKHEEKCAYNPINKACESCKSFHIGEEHDSCLKNEDIFCGTKRNCEKWKG